MSEAQKDAGSEQAARTAAELLRKGEEVSEEVFERLNKSFITPLDPEDLHELAAKLDTILNAIEAVVYRMHAYRVPLDSDGVGALCTTVNKAASRLCEAFGTLKHRRFKEREQQLTTVWREIEQLERDARQSARKSTLDLLNREHDPALLIKAKEIYDRLEDIADRVKGTADTLRNVIVKNS